MSEWFAVHRAARSSLMDFFLSGFNQYEWAEDSFARIVRGLESWHRTVVGGLYMDESEYQGLYDQAVMSAASTQHREFLRMRLKYGNEPTLKRRLDESVAEAGPPVSDLVSSLDRFTRRVTEARNSLAHRGTSQQIYTRAQMWHAQAILQLVLRSVLLRRLGFGDEEVAACIARTEDWRTVSLSDVLR